ncbi:MAG: hypothetical protein SGCHY_000263, partial [Lobulomycetales sp.]
MEGVLGGTDLDVDYKQAIFRCTRAATDPNPGIRIQGLKLLVSALCRERFIDGGLIGHLLEFFSDVDSSVRLIAVQSLLQIQSIVPIIMPDHYEFLTTSLQDES